MLKKFNKYIIIIITFYIFWLGVLPLCLSAGVKALCKNFTANSDYTITINKPAFKLSVIPILSFETPFVTIKQKSSKDRAVIKNFKIRIRLLPL